MNKLWQNGSNGLVKNMPLYFLFLLLTVVSLKSSTKSCWCGTPETPHHDVIFSRKILWTSVMMLKSSIRQKSFPPPTRWCVSEGCGVMSQLLPPAMSTVQPAAEAHQHQPRCHAQSGDEGRLPDDTGYLLWYAKVTAFLYSGWCLACWDSWEKSMVCGQNDLLHIRLHFSPVKTKRHILSRVR